ncbi:MAG: hypothetical protein ACTTKY_00500 [Catonella sp.]
MKIYVVSEDKDIMIQAGYKLLVEYPQEKSNTLYLFLNLGDYNKIPKETKKKLVYTNKLFL